MQPRNAAALRMLSLDKSVMSSGEHGLYASFFLNGSAELCLYTSLEGVNSETIVARRCWQPCFLLE